MDNTEKVQNYAGGEIHRTTDGYYIFVKDGAHSGPYVSISAAKGAVDNSAEAEVKDDATEPSEEPETADETTNDNAEPETAEVDEAVDNSAEAEVKSK